MAESENFFKLKGKIGDLIFFSRNGKSFVKMKTGGFVNGKSNDHPNTKAVQKSFSEVASFTKYFKEALYPMLWKQKDGSFHNQLVSLFAKIKKATPDHKLYTAFKEGYALDYLQNSSLNKNSALNAKNCYYNQETNVLGLSGSLIKVCNQQLPNGYLEINTAWLSISEDLEVKLNDINTYYLDLKTPVEVNALIEISFSEIPIAVRELVYPVVSLVVVYSARQEARPYHDFRYTLITFL